MSEEATGPACADGFGEAASEDAAARELAEHNALADVFDDVRAQSAQSALVEPTRWPEIGLVPEHLDAEEFEMLVYEYLEDERAAQAEDEALAEQRSVEEARAAKQLWTADATALGAVLPAEQLVEEALAVGREEGGLGARLAALFGGWTVEVRADYDAGALERLAADIDATIGSPRVDFGLAVDAGHARVTEGHDGSMVDRAAFARELDRAYLTSPDGRGSFVARAEYAPLRIDRNEAQAACDAVNAAIADGARFTWAGTSWEATAADLGEWVVATPVEHDGGWVLAPSLDEAKAKPAILAHVQQTRTGDPVHVTFERADDEVRVRRDEDLFALGLLDSMGAIELLVDIEDEFGVFIAPTEVERAEMNTVNLIIHQVEIRL